MNIDNIGVVIATRSIALLGDTQAVTVTIGTPQAFSDGKDYYCPYQIIGIGDERIRYASGVDTIQALFLALKKIGSVLHSSDPARAGSLTWLGNSDLGFPMA
jgi:hypothetical protein